MPNLVAQGEGFALFDDSGAWLASGHMSVDALPADPQPGTIINAVQFVIDEVPQPAAPQSVAEAMTNG